MICIKGYIRFTRLILINYLKKVITIYNLLIELYRTNMKLYIKNMNSPLCHFLVREELVKLGINCFSVENGVAEIAGNISVDDFRRLAFTLAQSGLELQEINNFKLVEKIKDVIIEYVHIADEPLNINFSDHLSIKLQYDYTYLANVFSKEERTTIEKFIIDHKIERAKKMIGHCDLKLTEIAVRLHYSSVAHFSNQFKKVTGLTPSTFRKQMCKEHV